MLIILLFVVVRHVQHEVKKNVNINAYNFLNNGTNFNSHALLELSQSLLCICCIRFHMSDLTFNYHAFRSVPKFNMKIKLM